VHGLEAPISPVRRDAADGLGVRRLFYLSGDRVLSRQPRFQDGSFSLVNCRPSKLVRSRCVPLRPIGAIVQLVRLAFSLPFGDIPAGNGSPLVYPILNLGLGLLDFSSTAVDALLDLIEMVSDSLLGSLSLSLNLRFQIGQSFVGAPEPVAKLFTKLVDKLTHHDFPSIFSSDKCFLHDAMRGTE
jgi:hypothetical protein